MAQKQNKQPQQTWNKITGKMKIFGNAFETKNGKKFVKYSVSFAGKDDNDEYQNYYLDIRFTESSNAPVSAGLYTIDVDNAFLSTTTYQKGKETIVKPVLIVTECEIIDEPEQQTKPKAKSKYDKELPY